MKINITKKQYRLLMDMLYLSDWMINAHIDNAEDYHHEYKALRKMLLSHYKEMGAADRIEYSKELNDYCEKDSYDSELHEKFIDPYDDETFWEELLDRLATRDLVRSIGVCEYESMDRLDRIIKLEEMMDKYREEFSNNGIDQLIIKGNLQN